MSADRRKKADTLRERAEALLAKSPEEFHPSELNDVNKLAHELAVHQAELELQNEELRDAQVELQKVKERFTTLYEHAPVGYVVLDAAGIIRQINTPMLALLNRHEEDLRGKPFTDSMVADDAPVFLSHFRTFFRNPKQKQIIVRMRRKDSKPFYAQIEANPQSLRRLEDAGEEGNSQELMAVVSDITELHKAQQQIEGRNRELQRANERIEHTNRVLLGIRNVNQLIVSEDNPVRLIEGACENLTETMGYLSALLVLLDDAGHEVTAATASGFKGNFELLRTRIMSGNLPQCMHRSLQSDKTIVVTDPATQCLECPFSPEYSARAGLCRRLTFEGKTYGILVVSIPRKYAASEEEQDLFNEVVGDLAFGLHKIEMAERLRKNEELLRAASDASLDSFFVCRCVQDKNDEITDFVFDHINTRAAEMLQMKPEDIIGQRMCELFPINRTGGFLEKYKRVFETGIPLEEEFYLPETHVPACWYYHQVVKINNGIVISQRDISERKQTEENLARNKAELQAIYDNAQVMLCMLDEDRRVLYANPAFTSFTGVSEDELRAGRACGVFGCVNAFEDPRGCGYGCSCADCKLLSALENALATGVEHKNMEVRLLLDRDGERRSVTLLASIALVLTDIRKNLLLSLSDITELKKSEEELRKISESLQAILNHSPLLISEMSLDGTYVRANAATAEMFGRPPSSLAGTSFDELLPEDTVNVFRERITRVTKTRKPVSVEDQFSILGAERHYLTTLYPLFDSTDNVRSVGGIAHDITDRVLAENRVRQQAGRLQALVEILQYHPETIQDFLDHALDKAINLTESKIGYIYSYDEDRRQFEVNSWSKDVMKECAVFDPQTCYELDTTGIWGDAVRQRKPILLNDFQNDHPLKKGFPTGHVSIKRFLTVPVFHSKRIVAVVGLANKSSDYDESDVLELTLLMDTVWKSVEAMRSEQALQDRERFLSTILSTAVDGFWVIDSKGCVTEVNGAYCAMSGYTRQELLGMRIGDIEAIETPEETQVRIARVIRNGSEIFETFHRNKNGSVFPVEVSTTYLAEEGGQFVCFCRDLTERKQHEEHIGLLGSMLDAAPTSITIRNADGRSVFSNQAAVRLHGYESIEEFLSVNLHDLSVPESEALIAERMRRITEEGEARFEVGHYRKDGSTFHLEIRAKLIDWKGSPAVLNIGTDITERRKAEETLRNSEHRFRSFVENANDIVYALSPEGVLTYISPNWIDFIGEPADEAVGKSLEEYVHPDDGHRCRAFLETVLATGEKQSSVEYRVRHRDGKWRWHLSNGSPAKDDEGNVTGYLGIARDVTERKQAQLEREQLSTAIEQSGEIIVITGTEGNIQYVNPVFEQITGYEPHQVVGQNPRILKSGKQSDEFYRELWETISSGQTWQGRFVNKRKDGSLYTEDATISPVYDAAGVIGNYVAVKRNVTEQLRMEEQYRQAQKMESVGRLAGGVAHDFNNMLSVITGNAELALSSIDASNPVYVEITEILNAARRSAGLIQQLLAFARKQTVAPKTLDANETIGSMIKMLRRLIGEDIDLLWMPADRVDPIRMDPVQIDQMLANLLVNARDAIGHGVGKVTIETAQVEFDEEYCRSHRGFVPGHYAMIAVSDDGCGMDEETKAQAFEPFYTTKAQGEGTGLGLATVYGIIKQNHGVINVYSEPDTGTTIRVYLPVHKAKSFKSTKEVDTDHPLNSGYCTILLVEDEPAILAMGKKMLERLGYTVIPASAPGEAIRLAEEYAGAIDLLMTDVIMPGMNGRDLAGRILALYPEMKRLFMSGYTANVIARQGVLDAGVNFIQKPFSLQLLSDKVRQALEE